MKPILFLLFTLFSIINISAQEITVFPGLWDYEYYKDDIRINKKEVNQLMQAHEIPNLYWKKSKRHTTITMVAFGTQLVTSYLALYSLNNSIGSTNNNDIIFLAASLGAAGVALGYSFSSASLRKKAILGYNKLQTNGSLIFQIGLTKNGLGLACKF